MKLTPEEHLVLLLSHPFPSERALHAVAGLFAKTGGKSDPAEIDRLLALCQTGPLLYRNIRQTPWNRDDRQEQYKFTYIAHLSSAEARLRETLAVLEGLGSNGIKAIPLKGPIAAELLLGDPGLYRSSDIDLLVRPEDVEKALASLAGQGYARTSPLGLKDEMAGSYHTTVSKETFHIELHWNLVMRYFDADPGFWWDDAQETDYRGRKILQLSHEKFLLYLVFRLFSKGFLPLKFFILALGIISNQNTALDWDRFMRYAQELKMERLAIFTRDLVRDIFLMDIPGQFPHRSIFGHGLLKNMVLEGLFEPRINTHIRMALFLSLLDSPAAILGALLRRLFPTPAEVRLRYTSPLAP
ncbi:MAG: nucleotidyltransferase family protein [Nitrospirae bacterium]|nr:nucleotidyltransferase family protein [Nitrospirota bacterium]